MTPEYSKLWGMYIAQDLGWFHQILDPLRPNKIWVVSISGFMIILWRPNFVEKIKQIDLAIRGQKFDETPQSLGHDQDLPYFEVGYSKPLKYLF